MLHITYFYDYVLAEKQITTTLKKESSPREFKLQIITPARKFLGLSFGGGFVKLSRLYDINGKLIHARNYSKELNEEIKDFKKDLKIPYLKLWKGFIYTIFLFLILSAVWGIKTKMSNGYREEGFEILTQKLKTLQTGQLYGVSFFTDKNGNSIEGLPEGWIKIVKLEGDTLFIQRSKQTAPVNPIFDIQYIESIKPKEDSDWESKVERVNYPFLREELKEKGHKSFDLISIENSHKKHSQILMTIKGTEN